MKEDNSDATVQESQTGHKTEKPHANDASDEMIQIVSKPLAFKGPALWLREWSIYFS